ncbi:MAG TPA: MlaA family lipoprotein [Steroidobacteraceae bacterium]|jgi:phospholipid-binding lipoprotein MlaA|nr:MlaA family lipoprotein [Steroidobacteraceae bacterium]
MRTRTRALLFILGVTWLMGAGGCATVPKNDPVAYAVYKANNDPFEPLNRKTFAFNQGVDRFVLRPVAKIYVHVLPSKVRDGIRNFMKNLNEPLTFVNNVLQFQFRRAGTTGERFALNSTVGILGIFDFAGRHGMPRKIADFGQTLYVWRVGSGPYLVVPIFGPTTPRDGIGMGVDIFIDPLFYVARHNQHRAAIDFTRLLLTGIDERAVNIDTLDEIRHESLDFYAAMRSLYRQNREAELHNGTPSPPTKVPTEDIYADPGADSGGGNPQSDLYQDPAADPGAQPKPPADSNAGGDLYQDPAEPPKPK